jgi:hypothetical protein
VFGRDAADQPTPPPPLNEMSKNQVSAQAVAAPAVSAPVVPKPAPAPATSPSQNKGPIFTAPTPQEYKGLQVFFPDFQMSPPGAPGQNIVDQPLWAILQSNRVGNVLAEQSSTPLVSTQLLWSFFKFSFLMVEETIKASSFTQLEMLKTYFSRLFAEERKVKPARAIPIDGNQSSLLLKSPVIVLRTMARLAARETPNLNVRGSAAADTDTAKDNAAAAAANACPRVESASAMCV